MIYPTMKTPIVLLFCIVMLLNCACCIDPGRMMKAYGINIDVSRLLSKISAKFYRPARMGIQVRYKTSADCLDAYGVYNTNGVGAAGAGPATYPRSLSYRQAHFYGYGTASAACDSHKLTQKWTIDDGRLQAWSRDPIPGITGGGPICLDCASGAENCYIESRSCNASRIQQQFFVRVHACQLDITTDRIYFSLHSGANRKRCLTSYYSTEKGGQTYALDRCSGRDEQSFYINQDYSAEIQQVKSRVRVCASDSYAPACRSLYCP